LTAGIREGLEGEEDKDFAVVFLVDLSTIEWDADAALGDFSAFVTDVGDSD
jgi:hypothetical protein